MYNLMDSKQPSVNAQERSRLESDTQDDEVTKAPNVSVRASLPDAVAMGNQRQESGRRAAPPALEHRLSGLDRSNNSDYCCVMEELHAEVHRITSCPYTPSLKKLHEVLQNIDVDLLQLWTRGNPCQVAYLATITLEALELWPFTIDILKTMVSIPSFRDAVLQQKPVLLETLITNAIDSKSGFDKYAATCVALLSTPLELAIPANAPVFLMKCLEGAVQSLSSETIRPVYLLLSGLESSYIDILPFDIFYTLQSQMIRVLTNVDSDDHLASLLCLALLAKLSSRPGGKGKSQPNVLSSPDKEIGPESADRFLPARKFFSSRVPKTLDLVVIKAITVCSQNCQLRTHEIVESLKLSREIVDTFDKKKRNHWLAGNTRKTNKLREKVLRLGMEAKVQCEALNFLVALSAEESSPQEVIPNLQKYLLTPKADVLSANAIEQCIFLLEDASIRELLESLLAMACDKLHPSREALMKVDSGLRLISVFTENILASSKLLKAVLQSISSDMASNLLRQYASQEQEVMRLGITHGHSAMDVCPLSYREARARLHQKFSVLVLKSALHAPQYGVEFDSSALTLLLEKQPFQCFAQHASVECTQRRPMNAISPKISMFEAHSTPCMDSASLNWRNGLMREMSRDVDCRYEGVIRMVGEICRDLEHRCYETELPLREQQSKCRELQSRLESSERDKAELEAEARNHISVFSALETERNSLADQVGTTEKRSKEIGACLDDIRREFGHAKIKAERAAQAAIESARQQDLVYLATMTGKDEVLEEQSLRLASTNNNVKALEHELDRIKGLEAINVEKLNSSETHNEILNNAVSALEFRIRDLQDELIRVEKQNACNAAKISNNEAVIEELNRTLLATNEASEQNGSLISTLKDQLQKAEFETSELRLQHETYVTAKGTEFERLEESHRSSSDKWQSELEVAHRSSAAASEQFGATIARLQSKVTKLRQERRERAREFAEAQELSSRLMSIMGTNKRQMSSHGAEMADKRDLPSSDADNSDLPAANPFRSPHSASSRAPKRIKTQQDTGTLTTCAATIQKSITTTKDHEDHGRSTMRRPLANLENMQSPGRLTQKNPSHRGHHTPKPGGDGGSLTESDQATRKSDSDEGFFGGEDIFTSTNQQHLSAHSRMPRDDYDETTTEF